MPTKEDLLECKRELSFPPPEDSQAPSELENAGQVLIQLNARVGVIAQDVISSAGDMDSVGNELQSVASTVSSLGPGLDAIGRSLVAAGKAFATGAEIDGSLLTAAVGRAANALEDATEAVMRSASELHAAHGDANLAAMGHTDVISHCISGFSQIEQEIADVVGEVDQHIVSAWNDLVSLFQNSQQTHAHHAMAATAKSSGADSELARFSDRLATAAAGISAVVEPDSGDDGDTDGDTPSGGSAGSSANAPSSGGAGTQPASGLSGTPASSSQSSPAPSGPSTAP